MTDVSRGIITAKKYSDFQFSARHHDSPTYVKLLRSFLRKDMATVRESVSTSGDLRTDSIMVKGEEGGIYVVMGIIDWEDSGFYPEYYEMYCSHTHLESGGRRRLVSLHPLEHLSLPIPCAMAC